MIRVGFTLIGGINWVGGYNYFLNLLRALSNYETDRIQPVIFLGDDTSSEVVSQLENIPNIELVFSRDFNPALKTSRLLKCLVFGRDRAVSQAFLVNKIDVVFEVADYFGWRCPVAKIAWMPDFQHLHLKHLFSFFAYWKRDLGYRAQIRSCEKVMLSSHDAEQDCLAAYPPASGKTDVVPFAVPAPQVSGNIESVRKTYDLPEQFFFLPNQFWEHKNHTVVLEAIAIAKSQRYDIIVAASGHQQDNRDKDYFPGILHKIKQLGIENNFRLLGSIPYAHVGALMLSCKAFINPSKFEGWSTTVEEAKSAKVSMILSDIGVHREQAGDYADFFESDSPGQLAELLISYQDPENVYPGTTLVAPDASTRISQFARKFADLAESVIKEE